MTKEEYKQKRIQELGADYGRNNTNPSNYNKSFAMECGDWPTFRGKTSYEFTLELLLDCKYSEEELIEKLKIEFPENTDLRRPKGIFSWFSSGRCRNVTGFFENGILGVKWDRYKFFTESGEWIKGESIEEFITHDQYQQEFEDEIKSSNSLTSKERLDRLKLAERIPEKIRVSATVFKRNSDIVVEVLHRADGICERCNKPAPFLRAKDNSPYLEVHHILQLADGGQDTVENAQALCPNCHREAHYGK